MGRFKLGVPILGGSVDLVCVVLVNDGLVDGLAFFKFRSGFFGTIFVGITDSTLGRFIGGNVGTTGLARTSTFKNCEISPTFGKTGMFDVRSLMFFSIVFS